MKYVKAASLCVLVLMVTGTVVLAEEKPVWTVGDKGSQDFWHCWPDRLYPDEIQFPCRVIKDTESGFTFSAYNVFTDVTYRAVVEKRTANDYKPGSMDATQKMVFSRA